MWHEIKIDGVKKIERCVEEFEIWMTDILPYAKMKIKVYEAQDKTFAGRTDVLVKRKFDGEPEGAVGHGITVDEALENTFQCFVNMVEKDYPIDKYPDGLSKTDIEYAEYSDF